MKRWLLAGLLAACAHTAQREDPVVSDATRAPSGMSCNHCHATRSELASGRISPAPPWPGTLGRGLDVNKAAQRCATLRQQNPLSTRQLAVIRQFLLGEGASLPGQPLVYSADGWTEAELANLRTLEADTLKGDALYTRACSACHARGPGPAMDSLRALAPAEVAARVTSSTGVHPQDMPRFGREALSLQDIWDVASFAGGQP